MKRAAGLDIIRAAAIFFVVAVHFFLNTKYFSWQLDGMNMYIQTYLMWTATICVPLFLMLTGYLQSRKELSFGYFKGIIPILGIYLFYSAASILIREFYFHDEHLVRWIVQVFTFQADEYSWYINMYIGLFLLIPFLNMIARSLKSAAEHRILILVLIFLTALPQFFNNFIAVFPDWWMSFYPLTYYFIGAYIKEYQVKINKALAGVLFTLTILIEVLITIHYSKGTEFLGVVGNYGSFIILLGSVLFFLMLYDADIKNGAVKGFITWISILSLDIYLCSYITDRFVYKYVMDNIFVTQEQVFYYAAIAVPVSFLSAALLSFCRYKATELGMSLEFVMKKTAKYLSIVLLLNMVLSLFPAGELISAKSAPGNPELSRQIASEGMVLLKNNEQTLPLKAGEKVALFGVGQIDFVKGGGGSGRVNPEYVINLLQGLQKKEQEGKISIYKPLVDTYQLYVKSHANNVEKMSLKEMPLTEQQVLEAANQAETAIITIKRYSKENVDREPGKGDYELDDVEADMIAKVTDKFQKVVIVLNIGGVVDSSWLKHNDKIDSVLIAWQPGMEGGNAVSDVLCGDVNPSGKLADTFAGHFFDYPSSSSFNESKTYVNYEEDIFVGYRYFETFDPEYAKVIYEFGYGLSYTNFKIQNVNTAVKSGKIEVTAEVINTGKIPGKEVVQVYFSAPQGVLGKPGKELAAFEKTKLLAPGETQSLSLSFAIDDMSSYDDTGKVKKSAYIMEAGDYNLYVGNSIKNADENGIRFTYHIDNMIVTKQLTEQLRPVSLPRRLLADGQYENMLSPMKEPARSTAPVKSPSAPSGSSSAKPADGSKIMLKDVYSDQSKMDAFIAQLTNEQLADLSLGQSVKVLGGTGGIGNLPEYGIPNVQTADGPAGIRTIEPNTAWPCSTLVACTWNLELARKLGAGTAVEAKDNKVDIWLAPGMNLHRNPLNGRNFEYYSEDPLIAGKMAAAVTKGAQDNGIAVTLKHFAANNKEEDRKSSDSRVSERALREIYLKSFEIAVTEAAPLCIMSSYNYLNGVGTSENEELLTNILRKEWSFKGFVMTDWNNQKVMFKEVKAGNNVRMPSRDAAHDGNAKSILAAIANGTIERSHLERNIRDLLEVIMKTEAFRKQILNNDTITIPKSSPSRVKAADFKWASNSVNVEACKDEDKGLNPIHTNEGEWLIYDISVEKTGIYDMAARVASKSVSNALINIYIDSELTGTLDPGNRTGDWQRWKTVSPIEVKLSEGIHSMKVEFTKTGFNLNWLEFNYKSELPGADQKLLPGSIPVKYIIIFSVLIVLAAVSILIYKSAAAKSVR